MLRVQRRIINKTPAGTNLERLDGYGVESVGGEPYRNVTKNEDVSVYVQNEAELYL